MLDDLDHLHSPQNRSLYAVARLGTDQSAYYPAFASIMGNTMRLSDGQRLQYRPQLLPAPAYIQFRAYNITIRSTYRTRFKRSKPFCPPCRTIFVASSLLTEGRKQGLRVIGLATVP